MRYLKVLALLLAAWSTSALAQTCTTSSTAFQSFAVPPQATGTLDFDLTCNGAAVDALTMLAPIAPTAASQAAMIVRCSTAGLIDCYNGTAYDSSAQFHYAAGVKYHVACPYNVAARTYSCSVTPPGGAPAPLGAFAFRSTSGTGPLTFWSLKSFSGTHTVCDVTVGGGGPQPTTGEVLVSWQASIGADGYQVHRGPSAGNYTVHADVGGVLQSQAANLPDCATAFIAVTAYNSSGESGYSEERSSWPRPRFDAVQTVNVVAGQSVFVLLDGANFQSGDALQFSSAGLAISAVAATCNKLTMTVTASPAAALGLSDLTVTHTSGVAGKAVGVVNVQSGNPPPSPPNVVILN